MDQKETWSSWLENAEYIKRSLSDKNILRVDSDTVEYFAAIEIDKRGLEPFSHFLEEFNKIGGKYFTYNIDDGRTEVTTANRLRHICTGRNLIIDYAIERQASHILFLDSDIKPDKDTLPKLLEMSHPIVGGEVSTYSFSGPIVSKYPFTVQEHLNTAGYLLVEKKVFTRIRWRWEWGYSDDPCYHKDSIEFLGIPTYVRKDCIGRHYPEMIGSIETRGHDLKVIR